MMPPKKSTSDVTRKKRKKLSTEKDIQEKLAELQNAEWDSEESEGEAEIDVKERDREEEEFSLQRDFVKLNELSATTKEKISKKKIEKGGEKKKEKDGKGGESSVIYLGHVPHGFYEKEMNGFFSQFGVVKRLRLSRSKRTGRSKGYAFVEFEDPEVAKIVAETMNGYTLFDHRLVCHRLEKEKIHPSLFVGAGKAFRPIPWREIAKNRHNAVKTAEQGERVVQRLLKRENKKRKALAEKGIDYEFAGYKAKASKKPTKIKFDQTED